MLTIYEQAEQWRQEAKPVACATVVSTFGSSPQPVGAKMFVTIGGEMVGSVSAGCVESSVAQTAQEVLREQKPRLIKFGVSGEQAAEIGLACGGEIEIYLEPVPALSQDELFHNVIQFIRSRKIFATCTIINGLGFGKKWFFSPNSSPIGDTEPPPLLDLIGGEVEKVWATQQPVRKKITTAGGESELFIDCYPPPPRLIIIGAVHIAIPLIAMAKMLGFYTIVIDARAIFATRERFPHADELIKAYPPDILRQMKLDEGSYVVTLTHDEKFDNPSLAEVLKYPVRYVGALGSSRTHQKRLQSLSEAGVPQHLLARIHAPVGLDLGSRTPEEIALEIIAEMTAVRRGISAK